MKILFCLYNIYGRGINMDPDTKSLRVGPAIYDGVESASKNIGHLYIVYFLQSKKYSICCLYNMWMSHKLGP